MKVKINIVLFSFLIASLIKGFSQTAPDMDFLRCKASIKTGKYDSALILINKVLASTPDSKDAVYCRGLIYYNLGKYNEAIDDLKKIEKSEKGKASLLLARSYANLNDLNNCLLSLNSLLESNYRLPESMILLDKDFSVFENSPEWINFWRKGNWYSALDKTLEEATYLVKKKQYPEAVNILTEGLSKGYRKSPLYASRAEVYLKINNRKLALADLENALSGDSRNADLYARKARINYLEGNYRQSLDDYNMAVKLQPMEPLYYRERALALSKNGIYEVALKDMNLYLELFPSDDTAWHELGIIHSDRGNHMDALGCFNKSLALNPSVANYFSSRGDAYLKTRTYKYAWRDYAMSLDLDPSNPEVYLSKGIASVNLGDKQDACFCFERAKALGNRKADSYLEKYCKP